jgi:hypothetical protein
MGWRGRGGGWAGPWPGRGPFSYLPPWQRPGWLFGRGWCWWLWAYLSNPWIYTRFPWLPRWWWTYLPFAYPFPLYPPTVPLTPQSPKDEIAALEDYKKELEDEKASIEQEINDIESRIKELKAMLEKIGK